jgi:hypothetical protein
MALGGTARSRSRVPFRSPHVHVSGRQPAHFGAIEESHRSGNEQSCARAALFRRTTVAMARTPSLQPFHAPICDAPCSPQSVTPMPTRIVTHAYRPKRPPRKAASAVPAIVTRATRRKADTPPVADNRRHRGSMTTVRPSRRLLPRSRRRHVSQAPRPPGKAGNRA